MSENNGRPIAQDFRVENGISHALDTGTIDGFNVPRKGPNTQRSASPDQLGDQLHSDFNHRSPQPEPVTVIENLDASSIGPEVKSQTSQQTAQNLLGINFPKKGRIPSLQEAAELSDIDSASRQY